MEATPSLKRVLATLGDAYLQPDNEAGVDSIPVRFTDDTPHADIDGDYVAVNPDVRDTYGRTVDDTTELRIVADTLAHEVEHVNQSDLGSKQEMTQANPDMPKAAGMVTNILEDRYIDEQRIDRSPGQARTHKVKVDSLMENHQRRPRVDSLDDKKGRVAALLETALQVTATGTGVDAGDDEVAGWAKGVEAAADDLQEFAVRWDDMAQRVEDAHDLDDRMAVIQEGIDLLREYAPDGTQGKDMDDAAEQQGGGNLFDDDEAPDLDDLDLDPSDMEREGDVGDRDSDAPTTDDLADDLDDLGDGWDDDPTDQDMGDDPGDALDDLADDADADLDDMDGDGDGDAGGDGGGDGGPDPDGDETVDDLDGGGGGGDAAGDAEGDTSRVDSILQQHDPTDLEVVD